MKKLLFLVLLITSVSYGQGLMPTKLKITNNAISTTAPFVNVQEADGFVNKINKSDLIEVIEKDSAVNLPVTGVAGKIYVTLDNNRLYRWTGTIYQDLGYVDISNKVDKVTGKSLLSDAEITRLATLANYTHSVNHPPSIITQDGNNRFVTDAEKSTWNAKQNALGYTAENLVLKNNANGYAGLGSDGKLISSQLPSITISDTFIAASQAEMLAVTAETGDVVVRTDLNKSFILKGANPAVIGDWQELLTPTSAVTTVFGRSGAVTAQTGDYTATMVGAPSGSGTSTGTNTGDETLATIKTKLGVTVLSGSNTGDQTTITGNAGTATILQTARTINGVSFNGSANITIADATKEPAFTKNTAFNKNFGNAIGTTAEGNDSRINNGQTAFGWGNHAGLYPSLTGVGANGTWGINITGNASSATNWNSNLGNIGLNFSYWNDPIGATVDGLLGGKTDAPNTTVRWNKNSIQAWLGLGANAYSSTAFLPLTGGTLSGLLNINSEIVFSNPYNNWSLKNGLTSNILSFVDNQFGNFLLNLNPTGVGIGTTTPTEKLDVNGNIKASEGKFSSNVYANKLNIKSSPSNFDITSAIAISQNINVSTSHIIEDSSTITVPAGGSAGYGMVDMSTVVAGSNPTGHLHGFQSRIRYSSSANMPTDNFSSITSFFSENQILGTGIVDKVIGLKVADSYKVNALKVNKQYGVLIENQTVGNTNYGIWNDTRGNYFKALSIGSETIDNTNALNVTGSSVFSSSVTASMFYAGSSLWLNSDASDGHVIGRAGKGLKFFTNDGNSNPLSLSTNGSATFISSVTASGFFQSSDRRLKTILKRDGDVAHFKWKDNRDNDTHIGYIAQEVKREFSNQVKADEKGMLSVNYIEVLVAKVQALEKRITELEKSK